MSKTHPSFEEGDTEEWISRMEARLVKATALLRNRGLDAEPDREARVERAENMAAEDLLPGVR